MAGLAARVMAPRETAVVGVFAAVDDELEVAHRGMYGRKRGSRSVGADDAGKAGLGALSHVSLVVVERL